MAFVLIEVASGRAAQSEHAEAAEALTQARAAWERLGDGAVRLFDPEGRRVWKRGTCPVPEAEAADNAALAEAAGIAHLRLACPGLGGLWDLDRPIAPFARSFALAVEGAGDAVGEEVLRGPGDRPARLRDLIAHLDAALESAGRSATLTRLAPVRCDWPNRAHHRLEVTLAA